MIRPGMVMLLDLKASDYKYLSFLFVIADIQNFSQSWIPQSQMR